MNTTILNQVRVIRYAPDGGYAAREWLNAFLTLELPPVLADGESFRIGVQITKKRAIDVILRVESIHSFPRKIRASMGKSRSDVLFRKPKSCSKQVAETIRPLAVLSARHNGTVVRLLVCQPRM